MKYALGEHRVVTDGDDFYIAPTAVLIGKVSLGRNASIWWNAVLRGDNEPITVGENSNVQDGCVLHTDPGFPLQIGRNVSVGHLVVLHGCIIGDDTLIGIGSIVLNGARIGRDCLIGAGSLITEGKAIPDGSVVMGSPGRVVRQVTGKDREIMTGPARRYVERMARYRRELRPEER